jgi:hypothetical protein
MMLRSFVCERSMNEHVEIYEHWNDREKPGWHEYTLYYPDFNFMDLCHRYEQVTEWIIKNIDNPFKHARWTFTVDLKIIVKFRYERNLISFMLRWA